MDKIKNFILEFFFPSFCLGCQKEGYYLCRDCKSTLDILQYTYCLCRKNPLRILDNKGKCQRCRNKKLSGLYFALDYKDSPLTRKLIHHFKYPPYYTKNLAKSISEIILEHFYLTKKLQKEIWQDATLIPVPLHISKHKNRDYNQSQELAQELGRQLSIETMFDNLVKIKKTPPQIHLSAQERIESLKNAFKIKNPAKIREKKIFLIDDVYTTGSTMEECSRVLIDSGAKQVFGITIVREK